MACLGLGYHLGAQSKLHTTPGPVQVVPELTEQGIDVQEAEEDYEDEDEDEEMADGDLSVIKAGFMEQCKLVSYTAVILCNNSMLNHHGVTPGSCGAHRLENVTRKDISAVGVAFTEVLLLLIDIFGADAGGLQSYVLNAVTIIDY